MGLKSWLKTGDVYSRDFAYGEVPWKLDVFDTETYAKSPMKFTVVCTDLETGKPVYHECSKGDKLDVEWMRASASIPLAAVPVELDGKLYLDGGISDSIPVNWMLRQGYEKNVVICTRHPGYRKEHNKMMPLIRLKFRDYPEFVRTMDELLIIICICVSSICKQYIIVYNCCQLFYTVIHKKKDKFGNRFLRIYLSSKKFMYHFYFDI